MSSPGFKRGGKIPGAFPHGEIDGIRHAEEKEDD